MKTILFTFFILLSISFCSHAESFTPAQKTFLDEINTYRKEYEQKPIVLDEDLCHLSQVWAEQLALEDRRYHRPHLIDYCKKFGYKFMSENLHQTSADISATEVVDSWMRSKKGHRENLLYPELARMGIGWAKSKSGNLYVVWNGGNVKIDPQTTPDLKKSEISKKSPSLPFANPYPKR
jgi:uncharacterized protein YkwD